MVSAARHSLLRRRAAAVSTLIVAAAGTLLAGGAPAQAAGHFDLYALRSPGLHVNSNSCRNVTVTARTTADPGVVDDVSATVDVWRGRRQIDNVMLEPVHGNVDRLTGQYFYCPNLDGSGQFRLGSTEVDWNDSQYNEYTFIDNTTAPMTIKQATRARFTGTTSGHQRTFHVHAVYFSIGYGWHHYPAGIGIRLQRRRANGHGPWKLVQASKTDTRGNVGYTVFANKQFQYRVVARGTAHSWNLATRPLTR